MHCGLPGEVALLRLRLHPSVTPYQSPAQAQTTLLFSSTLSEGGATLRPEASGRGMFLGERIMLNLRVVAEPISPALADQARGSLSLVLLKVGGP